MTNAAGAEIDHPPTNEITTGIMLVNTGTPASPTPEDLRKYLKEFLSDRRVIRWPRWLWLPILHLIILRVRPQRVAPKYKAIWSQQGSPLLRDGLALAAGLERRLQDRYGNRVGVEHGMRYAQPSIATALNALRSRGVSRLIVLPVFPQYSHVTVASVFDAVFEELRRWPEMPELETICGYHSHPAYIHALVQRIQGFWQEHDLPDRLLISYHGIPQSYVEEGDPYERHCDETTAELERLLGTQVAVIQAAYQSRFGPEKWVAPYTDELLAQWGQEGAGRVDVVCPGFAVDCLETLYEIEEEGWEIYQQAGGNTLHYIPALNASSGHLDMLQEMLQPYFEPFQAEQLRAISKEIP
jgi:ferrochelatase